ncbi:LysR substrate-binding domain-containing protein [Serratia ureilytica]
MLMLLILQFLARYPQRSISDLSLDARVVNLVGEGFDVGIGSRVDPTAGWWPARSTRMHMAPAASPDHLARRGEPQTPHRPAAARPPAAPCNPSNGRHVKWQLRYQGETLALI